MLLLIITALAATLALLDGLPAKVGLWVAVVGAVLSIAAWFIPQDDRTREERYTEDYIDTHIKKRRK